ncbi:MAG: 6-pyruvoyl-tetrahydropterin synthase-related protein [Acidobacteriota bacterium]
MVTPSKDASRSRTARDLLILLALSISVVAPIYLYGVPNGNDLPQHYQFAIAYRDGLSNGTLVLGWSAAANQGFGDVGVRFYPPLSYWVLAGADVITGDWYDASVLTFAFWFFISGIGVYFWAREWFSENASLLGAALYLMAPYHVNQLYNAFTYAEFASAAVLPFCFLFATRVIAKGKWRDMSGLAISYSCLLLVHIPIAVLGSIGLGIYIVVSLVRNWPGLRALRIVIAFVIALAASSFYWLRVAAELPFVKHSTPEYSSGVYDFHVNFLAGIFYLSAHDYDTRSLWFADMMLIITIAMLLPGLALIFFSPARRDLSNLIGIACLGAFGLFISTPISLPLWEHLRVLQMIQFPWRALILISLCAAVLAAAVFEHTMRSLTTKLRPIGIIAIGLTLVFVIFTGAQIMRPAIFQDREPFLSRISVLSAAESYECWWPLWANKAAFEHPQIYSVPARAILTDTKSENGSRTVHLDEGPESIVRVPLFYYPQWKALVNKREVAAVRDENGVILVPVPNGPAVLELSFQEPYYVRVANLMSALAWLLLILLAVFGDKVPSGRHIFSYE